MYTKYFVADAQGLGSKARLLDNQTTAATSKVRQALQTFLSAELKIRPSIGQVTGTKRGPF